VNFRPAERARQARWALDFQVEQESGTQKGVLATGDTLSQLLTNHPPEDAPPASSSGATTVTDLLSRLDS